jgi:hypothetical protein
MATGNHALAAVNHAQTIASGIFARIGVTLEWRDYHSGCQLVHDHPILWMHTDERDFPEALAYSQPFEGRHVRIFDDRVLNIAPGRVSCVLAYVLVHEITHILQGTDWHSDSGIMKRRWDVKDYAQMQRGTLFF